MFNSSNSTLTYVIDSFTNNYKYYCPNFNYITRKIFKLPNNNCNPDITNYFNSLNNNFRHNYNYCNLYKPYNNYNNSNCLKKLSLQNIDFNKSSDPKISLTYKFENISPREITDRTQEIINLQSQMCDLQNSITMDNTRALSTGRNRKNKKKTTDNKFQSQKNIQKKNKIKKNKTFSYHNNYTKRSNSNTLNNNFNRINSLSQNRNNIWKNKYLKINEDLYNTKRKIEEIKNNNDLIERRIKNVKEKEENKAKLYENKDKIINYDITLLEKYKLSEKIRKKQIDLIIKMQKEVNNMREKLQMLGDHNVN